MVDVETATRVYAILESVAGAPSIYRDEFISHFKLISHPKSWRFGGRLGIGGKLLVGPWRVICAVEDITPEREKIISSCNEQLSSL